MGSVPKLWANTRGQLSALRAALTMAPFLRFRPSTSEWHIVSDNSASISASFVIDVAAGVFSMNVANFRTGQVITLNGRGGGGGIGAAVSAIGLPVSASVDPALLVPKTLSIGFLTAALNTVAGLLDRASANSPIYLVPGRTDSAQLFPGLAQIVTLSGAAFVEASCSVIVFYDNNVGLKAFAFLAGADFTSGVSVDLDDIVYVVNSQSANLCWVLTS